MGYTNAAAFREVLEAADEPLPELERRSAGSCATSRSAMRSGCGSSGYASWPGCSV